MRWLKRAIEAWRIARYERSMQRRLNRLTSRQDAIVGSLDEIARGLQEHKRNEQRYFKRQMQVIEQLQEDMSEVVEQINDTTSQFQAHVEDLKKTREALRIAEDVTLPRLAAEADLARESIDRWTSVQIRGQMPEQREAI